MTEDEFERFKEARDKALGSIDKGAKDLKPLKDYLSFFGLGSEPQLIGFGIDGKPKYPRKYVQGLQMLSKIQDDQGNEEQIPQVRDNVMEQLKNWRNSINFNDDDQGGDMMDKESLLKELQSLKNLHNIYVEQINEYGRKMRKGKHNSDEDWRLYHECEQIKCLLDDTKTRLEATIAQTNLLTPITINFDPDLDLLKEIIESYPIEPKTTTKWQGDED